MSSQLEVEYADKRLNTVYIRNLSMTASFKRKNIEDAMDYMPKDEDIIICSYPKTGTTWVSYIVWKLIHKHKTLPSLSEMINKEVPFMEMVGTEPVKSLNPPRMYRHHLPYTHMKVNHKAKYIYICRNPMDTVVSYYYFLLKKETYPDENVTFDYFFDGFLAGTLSNGNYFDHVLQFYEHKHDSHLLFLSYEDLHRDKKEQILKIANFLGKDYYQYLMDNETALQEIQTATEFNYMKQNIDSHRIVEENGKSVCEDIRMFRKGIIGDGKNILNPEQIKRLESQMMEKMKDTEILSQWIELF